MPNRFACDVLKEMRSTIKCFQASDRTYVHLSSLIEEAQTMFNRMEAALSDLNPDDLEWLQNTVKAYKTEKKKLRKEIAKLKVKIAKFNQKIKEKDDGTNN